MRILIIAQPRTGSTVFSKWLSKELNHYWLNEPFNSHVKLNIDKVFTESNIICKLIYEKGRGEWFYDNRVADVDQLLALNWDLTFILTREDVYNQAISKAWGDLNSNWHTNYNISDEWPNRYKHIIEKYIEELKDGKIYLNSLKGNQITYESVYETGDDLLKVCLNAKIDKAKYANDLSLKNRYRGGELKKNTALI